MLPKTLRFWLFETLSLKTMRYVHSIPRRKATGLVARVYDMIEADFFINGSLTSRSKVPALMAGIWTAGRESVLVDNRLDRTTKEAMNAVLSRVNDCPYCGDMLISLVHAGGQHERPRISSPKARRQSPTPPCASALPGSSRYRVQAQKRTRGCHSPLRNCRKPSQR